MPRIAGVASWNVGARTLAVKGNLNIGLSTVERAGIAGQDTVHGYSENPVVPFIEGDVSLQPGTSVSDVLAVTDETITVQAADKRTFTLKEAWQAGRVEVSTKEGQYRLRFEGTSCREIL
jgi:hypothetical protein